MSHKPSKLERDVEILAAMGGEMNEYLRHEVLFWPLTQGNMPRLTLGGFFLRVHRLTALSLLLTPAEQNQVRQAMDEFAAASQLLLQVSAYPGLPGLSKGFQGLVDVGPFVSVIGKRGRAAQIRFATDMHNHG